MTDYTKYNPDGSVNWAESHKARIDGNNPQPLISRPATGQITPKETKVETVDDRIRYAQSWNLAATLFTGLGFGDEDLVKKNIEEWQKYFHKKLTNK